MIVREFFREREDGVKLYRTYSDKGLVIKKVETDEMYEEAVDVESAAYSYVETDQMIDTPEGEEIKNNKEDDEG